MSEYSGREKQGDWLKIEMTTPEELSDALTNFLSEIGAQGVFQESPVPLTLDDPPPASASCEPLKAFLPLDDGLEQRLASLRTYIGSLAEIFPDMAKPVFKTEVIRDPDWEEAWKQYFKPLRVTRNFIIKPTWEHYSPEGGDVVIEIDPGMAFGTGQHASTRMCLEAIEDLFLEGFSRARQSVLDVGTGTGILGIACAKLGMGKILGVDVDEKAIDIAQENVRINQVRDLVGIAAVDVAALKGPYSLILANLTAKVLIELRPCLVRMLSPGGYLIISGIIEQNRADIEARFPGDDLRLARLLTEKEWLCYVLRKDDRP